MLEKMIRFKICGITNHEDAMLAIEADASAIGFIFAKKSPRYITPEKAKEIISSIPPFVQTVGVFVNEDPSKVEEIQRSCGIDLIQFHGGESPEICKRFMPRSIKAIRIKDRSSLKAIQKYKGCVKAILLDTYKEDREGGTGETFDWDLAVQSKEFGIPIILSGGIGPENVKDAISIVRQYAIDVNSKIEVRPGKKSPLLVERLVRELYLIQEFS